MVGVGRWALTLALPVSILIAASIDWLQQRSRGRFLLQIAVYLGAAFIAVEQAGTIRDTYSAQLAARYHEDLARLIPASCEAFLLVPPIGSNTAPMIERQEFDEAQYLAANPDVAKNWPGSAWDHYSQLGYRERRALDPAAAAKQEFQNLHYHLSAMIASAISGTPTVNGASGLRPPDYPVSNVYEQDIEQALNLWLSQSGGAHACVVGTDITPYELG
jgi:hypothetical protein